MSVSLNPSTALGFHRPLTQLAKRSLTITNNNAQPIAFKVKTTAPKLYCVRPNSGRVEPGHSVEVSVMLQAMREEPPPNAKCKDKFLIQSTLITPEKETLPLQDIWNAQESADDSSKVHQQKLRVTYLPPEGQPLPEETEPQTIPIAEKVPSQVNGHQPHPTTSTDTNENGVHEESAQEPAKQEPHRSNTPHNEYSVAREESHEHEEHTREVPIEDLPDDSRISSAPAVSAFETHANHIAEHLPATPEQEQTPLPVPPISSRHASGQPPVVQMEDIESHPLFQELVARYNAAVTELQQLRNEYAALSVAPDSEIRRRKPRSDGGSVVSDSEDDVVVYQQDGVPLQIVVIIALAVFITTYLFL